MNNELNNLKASIVIPSYGGRLEYLKDTLVAMQEQDYPADQYEIVTVDNSPDGKILALIDEVNRSGKHPVRYVRETKMGLLAARHAGAFASKGDVLVYVDDDVLAPNDWLEHMLDPFKDPIVACAGGKVLAQWEGKVPTWFSQFKPAYLSIMDQGDERKEIKYAGFYGCNMAVRRNYFFAVGGSNPEIIGGKPGNIWWMGSGECGLEDKLMDLGFKMIYEPRAWLYHRIPESRLKPEYFYWRLFMQGVDDSYRYIRNMRVLNDRLLYWKVVKEILLNICRSSKSYIKSLIKRKQRIRLIADGRYWRARAGHHIITLFSKKMRQHIFQDSYL